MGILERVWDTSAEFHVETDPLPLVGRLEKLLAVPLVAIYDTSLEARQAPLAVFADHEVMPNASLADVLFEERGISIDDRALVLFLPAAIESEAVTERLADVLSQLATASRRSLIATLSSG